MQTFQVKEWLDSHGIKYRKSGEEYEVGCLIPGCPNEGESQMYINESGAWMCHRCQAKGRSLKELEFRGGLVKFIDPVKTSHVYVKGEDVESMHKNLLSNPQAMDYLTKGRGLILGSIKQFKLGYTVHQESDAIVIPYFSKGGACVGIKYDLWKVKDKRDKSRKTFLKDSKIQAFNLHNANMSEPLIITEGEYDCISAWQYGYENSVSVPNGAQGFGEWIKELDPAPSFLLCFDNDRAGQEGAEKLAGMLGLARCSRVYPRLKDLNEYCQYGIAKEELDIIFESTEPFFKPPIIDISQYQDQALAILENPERERGQTTGWGTLDGLLGGVREGELTVVSGVTGHGKTTFSMALIANLIQSGTNCLILSPEMSEHTLLMELVNNHYRTKVSDPKLFREYVEQIQNKVFIANVYNQWTSKDDSLINHVFDVIDYAVKQYGVKFILLDHLRLFLNIAQDRERTEIDNFLQKCVRLAIRDNVHIWLVVQPRKLMFGQRKISIDDLKGSGNIAQDAHNVVLIHRNTTDKDKAGFVEIEVAKNRKFGTMIGTKPLSFDTNSMANYYELGGKK